MTGPDRGFTYPVVVEGLLTDIPRTTSFVPRLTVSGIRTGRYKMIRYADGEGELYDLRTDPNELHSLWNAPRHRALRYTMVRLWKQYRLCSGAACRVPLPADLQTDRTFLAGEYLNSVRARASYYDN